jgi:hypothetical protein
MNVPICINCVHFIDSELKKDFSKCRMFGRKNIITGEIYHEYAAVCRELRDMCGNSGKLFEKKPEPEPEAEPEAEPETKPEPPDTIDVILQYFQPTV